MSGRLFVPPVLNGVNLFTDFAALTLEQKFAKAFVRYMSGKRRYMHGIWEMNVIVLGRWNRERRRIIGLQQLEMQF